MLPCQAARASGPYDESGNSDLASSEEDNSSADVVAMMLYEMRAVR